MSKWLAYRRASNSSWTHRRACNYRFGLLSWPPVRVYPKQGSSKCRDDVLFAVASLSVLGARGNRSSTCHDIWTRRAKSNSAPRREQSPKITYSVSSRSHHFAIQRMIVNLHGKISTLLVVRNTKQLSGSTSSAKLLIDPQLYNLDSLFD